MSNTEPRYPLKWILCSLFVFIFLGQYPQALTTEGQNVAWLKALPSRYASSLPPQPRRTTTLQKLQQPANLPFYSPIAPKKKKNLLHSGTRLQLSCKPLRQVQKHTTESNSTLLLFFFVFCFQHKHTWRSKLRIVIFKRIECFIIAYI